MELTLRQKIGQLVLYSMDGREIDERTDSILREYCVGNVIHFGNNVSDYEASRALNEQLCEKIKEYCANVPPFISVDHEGGRVMRFGADFTWFPSSMALGAADDVAATEAVGQAMGQELRSAGFNLNFAPVVDIVHDYTSPVMGVRCFGDTIDIVTRHGAALARGLQSAGVMACLKHFPGTGHTKQDTHYFLPTVDLTLEELEADELAPYRAILGKNGCDSVMTTHILFPKIEERDVPATMSSTILKGILRNSVGFDGVIVTDGIQMKAIADHYGVERGCIEAIKAGCDLLCIGTGGDGVQDVECSCMEALYQAALSGEIPMERIDEAVTHILSAKRKYCTPEVPEPAFEQHAAFNDEISLKAVTEIVPGTLEGKVLCVSAPVRELAYGLGHADPRSQSFAQIAGEELNAPWTALREGEELPQDFDTLLIGVTYVNPDGLEMQAAQKALSAGKKVVFMLLGTPYGAKLLPKDCPAVCIYGLSRPAVKAAVKVLTGESKPEGKLPVTL